MLVVVGSASCDEAVTEDVDASIEVETTAVGVLVKTIEVIGVTDVDIATVGTDCKTAGASTEFETIVPMGQSCRLHVCILDVLSQPGPVRELLWRPPPQDCEQSPHALHSLQSATLCTIGQTWSLHACDLNVLLQSAPLRVLYCKPPPQDC